MTLDPIEIRQALDTLGPYGFTCPDIDSRSLSIVVEAARAYVDLLEDLEPGRYLVVRTGDVG